MSVLVALAKLPPFFGQPPVVDSARSRVACLVSHCFSRRRIRISITVKTIIVIILIRVIVIAITNNSNSSRNTNKYRS